MASKQSEAILEIGGEGGGYTILSKVTKDGRMFRLSADSLDFDSDDEENWTSRQEAWRFSIDAVFADLNPIWYRLYPLLVHPEFASEIWQKYVSASQEAREGPPRQHSNWTKLLLGRPFDELGEAISYASNPAVWDTRRRLQSLPAHWQAFGERLQAELSRMVEDQFLVITIKETNRFVQFAAQGAKGMRAEATSNHFLSGRERLDAKEMRALVKLGWHSPTGSPEEATPERDPGGSSNFFLDIANPIDFEYLAALAIRSLSEVYGAPHDGFLQYSAFEYGGASFALPALQIKPESTDPALKMGELADKLLSVLRDATGLDDLSYDSDGDVNFQTRGLPVGICLVGQPPMVRFFSPLMDEVKSSKKLLEAINHLNIKAGPIRYMLHKRTVIAVLDIPAWPFQVDHVVTSLDRFTSAIASAAAWLETSVHSTSAAGKAIH